MLAGMILGAARDIDLQNRAGVDGKRGAAEEVATVDLVGHESILYRNFA